MRRIGIAVLAAVLAASAGVSAQPAAPDAVLLRDRVLAALAPALPYPRASDDGTPANEDAGPLWVISVTPGDDVHIEVLANPLNLENQKRAVDADKQAQAAVMRAQQQSQRDYERALAEFARDGRTSPIREVTLDDEGIAGERFDAESRLTIDVAIDPAAVDFVVRGAIAPVLSSIVARAHTITAPAGLYRVEDGPGDAPRAHVAPAQARVHFGAFDRPSIRAAGPDRFEVSVPVRGEPPARRLVVRLSGNAGLIEQVLQKSDWTRIGAFVQE